MSRANIVRSIAIGMIGLGVVHLWYGHPGFFAPTEDRTWFLTAGFLLLCGGAASIATLGPSGPWTRTTALLANGSLAITAILLLASGQPGVAVQGWILLALAGSATVLTAIRARPGDA